MLHRQLFELMIIFLRRNIRLVQALEILIRVWRGFIGRLCFFLLERGLISIFFRHRYDFRVLAENIYSFLYFIPCLRRELGDHLGRRFLFWRRRLRLFLRRRGRTHLHDKV